MKYNDCYKDKTIIMERAVQLESLEDTFIPKVFKDKTWTKLLNPSGVVYSEIINEFFSNAPGRRLYKVLGKAQRVCDFKGDHTRLFGDSSFISANLSPI